MSVILIKTLIPPPLSDSVSELARVSKWEPGEAGGSLPTEVLDWPCSEVSSTFNLTALDAAFAPGHTTGYRTPTAYLKAGVSGGLLNLGLFSLGHGG